jgi:hypothetical protein
MIQSLHDCVVNVQKRHSWLAAAVSRLRVLVAQPQAQPAKQAAQGAECSRQLEEAAACLFADEELQPQSGVCSHQ